MRGGVGAALDVAGKDIPFTNTRENTGEKLQTKIPARFSLQNENDISRLSVD